VAATALAQTGAGAAQGKAAPSKAKVLNRAELDTLYPIRAAFFCWIFAGRMRFPRSAAFRSTSAFKSESWRSTSRRFPRIESSSRYRTTLAGAGRAADLLNSKGFKVAGAVGAQDLRVQGREVPKPAADKK
jgi:hypothetical protein